MFTRTISHALATITLALAGFAIQASDFQPLMNVARNTWPEKTRIAVVCDYAASAPEIQALADAAGPGTTITVFDTRLRSELPLAEQLVTRQNPDYMVLLPEDRLLFDGSIDATVLVGHLANRGIPTIGTTPKTIKQGAVFSLGEKTGGELLICSKLIGTIEVILPDKAKLVQSKLVTPVSNPHAEVRIQSVRM